MISPTIDRELHEELEKLTVIQQCEVLNFARYLVFQASQQPSSYKKRMGIPGAELMKFAGTISVEDAAEMMKAIEEGCGQVNPDDWK